MILFKGLVSGTIGAIMFIIFLFILDIGVTFSITAGVVSFAATLLIFQSISVKPAELEIGTVSHEFYQNILNEGYQKLELIQSEVNQSQNPDIQKDGNEILGICNSIFKNLEENPTDVTAVRQFFTYYLDALLTIYQKYNRLVNSGLKGEEKGKLDDLVTHNLGMLKELFHTQLQRLLEDDFTDLDTELQTMKKMMEMEGIHR